MLIKITICTRLFATVLVARPRYRLGHLTRCMRFVSLTKIVPSAQLRIHRKRYMKLTMGHTYNL